MKVDVISAVVRPGRELLDMLEDCKEALVRVAVETLKEMSHHEFVVVAAHLAAWKGDLPSFLEKLDLGDTVINSSSIAVVAVKVGYLAEVLKTFPRLKDSASLPLTLGAVRVVLHYGGCAGVCRLVIPPGAWTPPPTC